MDVRRIVKLVVAVGIAQGAGLVGSLFTAPNIAGWYATLAKPAFNPPNWIFAPVWTSLFILMGISLFLVWERRGERGDFPLAMLAFGVQLVLNIMWSVLFFGLQSPLLALIEIFILWAAIAFNIWVFYRIDKRAAWLLVPYIVWVSFAAFLNYSILVLN